jgi:os06g0109600 protein
MDTINQRLDLFEQETMPVIQYFQSTGKLITIDAQQTVEEIFEQTKSALAEF